MINVEILKENDYRLSINYHTKYLLYDAALEIRHRMETLFNKLNFGMDINKIVKVIRTILDEYEEEELTVCVANSISSYKVTFLSRELHNFEYVERIDIYNDNRLNSVLSTVHFRHGQLNAYINNCNENIKKDEMDYLTSKLNSGLKVFYNLQNFEPHKLSGDDKKLLEAFNLFYNEKIDFDDQYIFEKYQCMISFLRENGIVISSIDDQIVFGLAQNRFEIKGLESWINKVMPFINNYDYGKERFFSEVLEEKIKFLGLQIRNLSEHLPDEEKIQMMFDFCKLFIIKKRMLPLENDRIIVNYSGINRSEQEVNECLKLIRQLTESDK